MKEKKKIKDPKLYNTEKEKKKKIEKKELQNKTPSFQAQS